MEDVGDNLERFLSRWSCSLSCWSCSFSVSLFRLRLFVNSSSSPLSDVLDPIEVADVCDGGGNMVVDCIVMSCLTKIGSYPIFKFKYVLQQKFNYSNWLQIYKWTKVLRAKKDITIFVFHLFTGVDIISFIIVFQWW